MALFMILGYRTSLGLERIVSSEGVQDVRDAGSILLAFSVAFSQCCA